MQANTLLPLSFVPCRICNGRDIHVEYSGPIRDGRETGAVSGRILHCNHCDTAWLEPRLRKQPDYYNSNAYRQHIPYDPDDEIRLIRDRLIPFKRERLRYATILDIGAGNGMFLDVAKALGATTFFSEVNQIQREHLAERHAASCIKTTYVTLFDVVEHVDDPYALLEKCKSFMHEGSRLFISTPRTTGIDNPEHFYRTQHTWYFNDKSLDVLCTRAGLFRCRQWIAGEGDNQQLYQSYILIE